MKKIFEKFNFWIRKLLLDDVDKELDGLPKYHRGFGSKKDPIERIENRFNKQKRQNKG